MDRALASEASCVGSSPARRRMNLVMFYVYILRSQKDGKYYIGQTENILTRLKTHNSGRVPSTKHRTPFHLVGFKTFNTRNESRWYETELKKSASKRKSLIKEFESLEKDKISCVSPTLRV